MYAIIHITYYKIINFLYYKIIILALDVNHRLPNNRQKKSYTLNN